MIVTDIFPIDKKKRKVCLDGWYTFPLYNSELRRFKLELNSQIDEVQFNEIKTILLNRIKNRIGYLLEECDKSEYSIKNKLILCKYPEEIIDEAINTYKSYGYIDDYRFARNYINSKLTYQHKSRQEIINGLMTKGVNKEIITETINEVDFNNKELIITLLKKKGYKETELKELDIITKRKLTQFLLRKGYNFSDIKDVL